ncbi:Ser/Thr-rich protein T10 in DGCR region [Zea mays]|uniref:Ser/Thr-rich protein T10 in DGCR region n=1 Tax=Zea mays TaxID=4577 RepID=A0A1D6JCY2_MAIZE|nr:Ser/Thr-rich protein T10 in DGCR region [Zea mays]
MCIAAWAWHCHPTHRLLLLFNRDEYHSSLCPLEYATEIAKEADQYNGFNLILADVNSGTMVYISNRPGGDPVIQTVAPGLHVLSNAAINSPWPKAMRLGQSFKRYLTIHDDAEASLKQMVEELMMDTARPDRSMVPDTGDDPEWEYKLSSIFIDTAKEQARYGTRSMVALAAKLEGEVTFYERYLENSLWKENLIQFQMEKAQ